MTLERSTFLGLFDEQSQLLGRVDAVVPGLGRGPKARSTACADRFRRAVNGVVSHAQTISGGTSHRASASGWSRAAPFGASSPKTTWRYVTGERDRGGNRQPERTVDLDGMGPRASAILREDGLGDPTEAEAGQGDAQLAGRE